MKVAITSRGSSLDSLIDPRFGRCAYFAIHDTETKETEFVVNPNKDANEGAGPSAVKFILSHKAEKAVAGEFGFKIKSLMTEVNIQMIVVQKEKTVKEIVDMLNK